MERSKRFLLHCPVLARLGLKYLGIHIFGKTGEIAGIDINSLNKFLAGSKRIADF